MFNNKAYFKKGIMKVFLVLLEIVSKSEGMT